MSLSSPTLPLGNKKGADCSAPNTSDPVRQLDALALGGYPVGSLPAVLNE